MVCVSLLELHSLKVLEKSTCVQHCLSGSGDPTSEGQWSWVVHNWSGGNKVKATWRQAVAVFHRVNAGALYYQNVVTLPHRLRTVFQGSSSKLKPRAGTCPLSLTLYVRICLNNNFSATFSFRIYYSFFFCVFFREERRIFK